VIYLDSSIVLAHVFAEPQSMPDSLWRDEIVSSRLLEYEVWNRVHGRKVPQAHAMVRTLIDRIGFFELDRSHLACALEPFPVHVRSLDSLHLATIEYVRGRGHDVELASFDRRMIEAARALGIPLYEASRPHGLGA
jgi:predicted nucleic acid-binding protein